MVLFITQTIFSLILTFKMFSTPLRKTWAGTGITLVYSQPYIWLVF